MTEVYLDGHHDSVPRSHRWRTAENPAGYLLAHLRRDARVLDVAGSRPAITPRLRTRPGCGGPNAGCTWTSSRP